MARWLGGYMDGGWMVEMGVWVSEEMSGQMRKW